MSIPTDPPQMGNPKVHRDGWSHTHPDGTDWVHQSGQPCTDVTTADWLMSAAHPKQEKSIEHRLFQKAIRPLSWFDRTDAYEISTLIQSTVDVLLDGAKLIGTPKIETMHVGFYEVDGSPSMIELQAWVTVVEKDAKQ